MKPTDEERIEALAMLRTHIRSILMDTDDNHATKLDLIKGLVANSYRNQGGTNHIGTAIADKLDMISFK